MHKLLLLIISLLFVSSACYAQDDTDSIQIAPKNQWFLKLSPLAIFETDGGIGSSVEYVVPKQKLGIQVEIQPILFSVARNGYKFDQPTNIIESERPTGIEVRPEIRYYVKGLTSTSFQQQNVVGFNNKPLRKEQPIRVYVAVDFLFKKVTYDRLRDFIIFKNGIQYTTPVRATYIDIKTVYGLDFKVGSISQSFPNPHWWVEAFAGVGVRVKRYTYTNIPEGAAVPDRFTNLFIYRNTYASQSSVFRISLPAGIKLMYRL